MCRRGAGGKGATIRWESAVAGRISVAARDRHCYETGRWNSIE